MATTTKIRVFTHNALIFTTKTCFRSLSEHPLMVGTLCFLLILYRFVPIVFFFLVSSSPVIACTGVLLAVILSHGGAHGEEEGEEGERLRRRREGIANLRSGVVGDKGLVVEKKKKSEGLKERDLSFVRREVGYEGCVSSSSSDGGGDGEELEKKNEGVDEEGEGEGESGVENEVGEKGGDLGFVGYSEISKGVEVNGESSDSESDKESDSTTPDASMADIMPMLDELHPLLDSEPSQLALVAVDSGATWEKLRGSEDEKVENAEMEEDENENEDEDEDDEDEDNKQGGVTEAVVKWTQEDEKNLMLLGNSELERNRRLENLIARRRMRNSFKMLSEKNLIDFEADAQPQMAPIATTRSNPFDLHYDSNDGADLPPIPGSAPSVMRRNPFDIPYDPLEEKPNLGGGSFEEDFSPRLEKDAHMRRYESFSTGSYLEKTVSKFRPYFVPTPPEGPAYSALQRQMSEISESKMSSVTETESVKSVSQSVPHEQELSQQNHDIEHAPDHVKLESSSSSEADVERFDQEHHRDTIEETESIASASDQYTHSNKSEQEHCQPIDLVERVRDDVNLESSDEEILDEIQSVASPIGSDATDVNVKPEAAEEKRTELSSSPSSEGHADIDSKSDDTQTKEPVYDSHWSPSEAEKTLSGITIIQEALSFVNKKVFTSASSVTSNTHMEDGRSSSGVVDHKEHQETPSPMAASIDKGNPKGESREVLDTQTENLSVADVQESPSGHQFIEFDFSKDDPHIISTSEKAPTDSASKELVQNQLIRSESGWAEIIAKVIEFEVKPNFRNALGGGRKKSFKKSKSGVRETHEASSSSPSATVVNDASTAVVEDSNTTVLTEMGESGKSSSSSVYGSVSDSDSGSISSVSSITSDSE